MDGVLARYLFDEPYEALFRKNYFKRLPPQTCFIEAIKILYNKGYDVRILSAYLEDSKYALKEKKEWLREWLPTIPEEQWMLMKVGVSKGDYLNEPGDILIDDYGVNCKQWEEVGGRFFKVSAHAKDADNEKLRYDHVLHPEMNALEVVEAIEEMIKE
jgi:5'(3')-deoxyribonucleotidase